MNDLERRDFLKAMSATGVAAASSSIFATTEAEARGQVDIGEVKSVKVDVLTETSWFDNDEFKKNIVDYGGASTNQYTIPWTWENAGGYAALITVTTLDGEVKKILMDFGWNTEWMDYIWERNGIPDMLKNGEIEFAVLSHGHLDHLWGIESTMKHKSDMKLYVPSTLYPEDKALLNGKANHVAKTKDGKEVPICKNDIPHTGELIEVTPEGENGEGVVKPFPGMAIKLFDVPILLRVRGENVLYFNVKDKGIVTVTGCCHPGILTLFSYARRSFKGYKPYGVYGGLHISLFENWDPKFDDIIRGVKAFKVQRVACNHCTGWVWAEKASTAGIPIVKGTDKYKTYPRYSTVAQASNAFLTNGDSITF